MKAPMRPMKAMRGCMKTIKAPKKDSDYRRRQKVLNRWRDVGKDGAEQLYKQLGKIKDCSYCFGLGLLVWAVGRLSGIPVCLG